MPNNTQMQKAFSQPQLTGVRDSEAWIKVPIVLGYVFCFFLDLRSTYWAMSEKSMNHGVVEKISGPNLNKP